MRKKIYLLAGKTDSRKTLVDQLSMVLGGSGAEHPSVAYIGTASGDSRIFMKFFERPLKAAGASSLTMAPLIGKKADIGKAEEILRTRDVILISGGEVEDGMQGLPAEIRRLMKELLEEGKQYAGLSAGAIMMGKAWPHWEDEDRHPEEAVLFDCLGFTDLIFDAHAEDEGWPELKKAVELAGKGTYGWGIPTGEMAVIDEDGRLIFNKNLISVKNN